MKIRDIYYNDCATYKEFHSTIMQNYVHKMRGMMMMMIVLHMKNFIQQ
jgi:hypothetical protein